MTCRQCGNDKKLDEFYVDRSRPRGRVARCKPCYAETQRTVTSLKPYRREGYVKYNASKRGLPYTLTREQFMEFWQRPCKYCGIEIGTIGLDRVDNDKGYELGNVVACCSRCNLMKGTMDTVEFIRHAQLISKMAGL